MCYILGKRSRGALEHIASALCPDELVASLRHAANSIWAPYHPRTVARSRSHTKPQIPYYAASHVDVTGISSPIAESLWAGCEAKDDDVETIAAKGSIVMAQ